VDPDDTNGYPQPGEIIDEKYRIERLLGAGGMGAVVEATHLLRRAPVALKFMSARLVHDPAVVERFLNEGVAASRINNEHVVSVLDVSKLPSGQPYLVMEYLEGLDLAKLLANEGTPGLRDVPRCVHFVLQVLRGLQVAHAASIIHRDLKPANCLVVRRDDEPDFLKIVDFGISKLSTEPLNLTKVGSALGTPLYVSPEQARDPASVDARGDLYSVAVILYELLSGRTPFHPPSGQLSELFMALATKEPQSLDTIRGDLPPGLDSAVLKGLAKTPDARYRSAADMAAALVQFGDLRSERVARQLLQRSTLRPSGGPGGGPSGGPGGGSLRPPEQPAPASTRLSTGASSTGSPTEKLARGSHPGMRGDSSRPGSPAASGSRPGSQYPDSQHPGSLRPGWSESPASFPLPGPATERVGSPETERVSSQAGANWLTGMAPLDTAAPTTLPTFLRRRQTELKIGLPLLAALVLAAVLFKVLRGSAPHSAAAPVDEVIPVQHLDTTPAPVAPSVPAPQALTPPTVAPVQPLPAQPLPVQPLPVQPVQPVPTQSAGVHPQAAPPAAQPSPASQPAVRAEPPPSDPHPARGKAPKRRRPSLKQIGIEQ
jgi:serine/threonine-protein kinase